jgi:hypothetical protein
LILQFGKKRFDLSSLLLLADKGGLSGPLSGTLPYSLFHVYHQLVITATRTLGFSRTVTALDLGRSVDIASARSRALVINVIQHPDATGELAQCQHQIPPAHGDFGVAAARDLKSREL